MRHSFDKARFIERLRAAVELRAGTQAEAAGLCGVPVPTLEGYLSGANLPGLQALATISSSLGVSLDWLVFGKGRASL
jgi:transcriptional regulator with XRE-family HTH domain